MDLWTWHHKEHIHIRVQSHTDSFQPDIQGQKYCSRETIVHYSVAWMSPGVLGRVRQASRQGMNRRRIQRKEHHDYHTNRASAVLVRHVLLM